MADKEVKVVFKVDGVDGYITDLNDLSKALNKTKDSTDKLEDSTDDLNKTSKKADKAQGGFLSKMSGAPGIVGAVAKSVQGLSHAFKLLLANPVMLTITAIVGALTALFKAFTSTKEGGETLERFMTGFGAVMDVIRDTVLKLGSGLIDAFKNPKETLTEFATTLKTYVTDKIDNLLEGIGLIGGAIKKAFSGDLSGALEDAKDGFVKVGDAALSLNPVTGPIKAAAEAVGGLKDAMNEAIEEGNRAAELKGVLQDLTDQQRDLNVERAEQNKIIAEAKNRAADENLSIKERKQALEEAAAAEDALLQKELELETQRLAAMEEMAAMSDSSAEDLDALAQQRIKLANLEEQSLNKTKELQSQQNALTNKQRADEAAAAAEKEKTAAEEIAKQEAIIQQQKDLAAELAELNMTEDEKRLKEIEDNYKKRLELAGKNEELIKQVKMQKKSELDAFEAEKQAEADAKEDEDRQKRLAKLEEYNNALIQAENALQDAKKAAAQAGLNMAKTLAGDNEKLQNAIFLVEKAVAIGKIIIDAQKAKTANLFYAATLGPAGPAYLTAANQAVNINTATSLATIAATTIAKFKNGGGGGGAAGGGAGGGSLPTVAAPSYNFGQAGGPTINPNQNSVGQGINNEPIKAYVIANDVTNAQQANAQIENLAKL